VSDLAKIEPRRVVVIKPSSLGDIVHALPTLVALRERWPRAHLAWVVNQSLRGLVEGHSCLDEVICFDRARFGPSPAGLLYAREFGGILKRQDFDLAIDLQGLLRSGLMTWATGARVRIGLSNAREGSRHFYTHLIDTPVHATHAVDRLLAVASAVGGKSTPARFELAIDASSRAWAEERLAGMPRPRLAVNLGARWATKRWPVDSFAAVAKRAADRLGAKLVLVGAGEDRSLAQAFDRAIEPRACLDLCGETSLPRLAAVLEGVDALLSNDTGPLHLAAAAGTRVIGIYTCTSPQATGPFGPKAIAVETRVWCAASRLKQCGRMECLTELEPERVWPAVKTQLLASLRDRAAA
jgi:lipopolysaccharide heptosyltransferase II